MGHHARHRLIAASVFAWAVLAGCLPGGHAAIHAQSAATNIGTPAVDIADCPVTPYAAEVLDPSFSSTWFGSGDLWAAPDVGNMGTWFAEPEWMKVQWRRPIGTDLTVAGRRLDGDAPPLAAEVSDGYDLSGYTLTPMTFPEAGCWEVIGRIPGEELRFVVLVHPGTEHCRHTPPPVPDPTIWQTLSRPLETPTLGSDSACPASPGRKISRVEGVVFGNGPVSVQGQGSAGTLTLTEDGTLPLRWIFSPKATGPFLMRSVPLDGAHASFGATDPQPEFRFSRRLLPQTADWQIWCAAPHRPWSRLLRPPDRRPELHPGHRPHRRRVPLAVSPVPP